MAKSEKKRSRSSLPAAKMEHWNSRIGVILAVAGSAVGLGNFLRFPGQAAQHGGGAFMIPYFISMVVLGIPICWAEWTLGRYGGAKGMHSGPGIFSAVWPSPVSKYFGALAVLVPLVIYMYYVVIEAWCLGYAYYYLIGSLNLGPNAEKYSTFFTQFVGSASDGFLYDSGHGQVVWFLLVVFVLNLTLVYRGLSGGIETFCKYAIPAMAFFAVLVLLRVLTLGTPNPSLPDRNVVTGLGFMWNPEFSSLLDPKTWLAASGQIFFSLSVGFGVIINFSSYLRPKDDIALSGLTAASLNEFFEVCLGGLITLPAAFLFLGTAAASFGTFGLGFNALPNVFALMPGGQVVGFVWFFLLFLAAVTSSLSMLQPATAFLQEGFALKKATSVTLLGIVTAIGSAFVLYFSKAMVAMDTLDFWVGTLLIFTLGTIQVIVYGWVFGIKKGNEEMHRGAKIQIPWSVQLLLKYVAPTYLLLIFGAFCYVNVPEHVKQIQQNYVSRLSIIFVLIILAILLLLTHLGRKRFTPHLGGGK